jgi:thioredoxin 1
MSNVIVIENETQLNKIISENENVIVDFFAEWCGPCKMLSPVLDDVSTEMENVVVCKVNVDENSGLASENNIRGIPTVLYYKGGDKVASKSGYLPKNQFIQVLRENLKLN